MPTVVLETCAVCGKQFPKKKHRSNPSKAGRLPTCSFTCSGKLRYPGTPLERFENKLDKSGVCWLWTGARRAGGYGKIGKADGTDKAAHRVAWELYRGEIPSGLFVCHKCDTPLCCNPDHLFLGTQKDNMSDCAAKGRVHGKIACVGSENAQAKLTDENVREIRRLRKDLGMTYREIGRKFGVTVSTVEVIVNRKSWAHVE